MAQVAFLLLALLHLAQATNYDYDYNNYYDDTVCDNCPDQHPEWTPVKIQFLVEPLTLTVNEGDGIRLPCLVDQFDQFSLLLWKKDSNVLAIGDKVINLRVHLERVNNGVILHLPPATLGDEGEYTCTPVNLSTSKELVHRVKVRAIPRPGDSRFDQVHRGEVRTTSTTDGLAALLSSTRFAALHSALQNAAPLLALLASNCLSLALAMASG